MTEKLAQSKPGETFAIGREYLGDNSNGWLRCFVMVDSFDPASMDIALNINW